MGDPARGILARLAGLRLFGGARDPRQASDQPERWCVIDTETTGLDPERDHLLSIGGIAMVGGKIAVNDSFECVLRHDGQANRENILVHRIGIGAQQRGVEPHKALTDFLAWVDGCPLLAFHAPFDQRFLTRACRQWLDPAFKLTVIDIATIAQTLMPQHRGSGEEIASLDTWLTRARLESVSRHSAVGDAYSAAMLLLWLCGRLPMKDRGKVKSLHVAAYSARWLG